MKQTFFKYFGISIFIVFVLNAFANLFFLYYMISWFDMLMHFFGGITSGFLILWLAYKDVSKWIDEEKLFKIFKLVFVAFLLIAVLWEGLEFSVQGFFQIDDLANIPDSISDTIFGLAGALIGSWYLIRKYKEKKISITNKKIDNEF